MSKTILPQEVENVVLKAVHEHLEPISNLSIRQRMMAATAFLGGYTRESSRASWRNEGDLRKLLRDVADCFDYLCEEVRKAPER